MTSSEYIAKGFQLSLHMEQAVIDRAERDVRQAYIAPIYPDGATESETEPDAVKDAVMNLAFMLMLQRNVFETRSGAKVKNTGTSQTPSEWERVNSQALTAAAKIDALRQVEGADAKVEVTDICGIYFKTQFGL